MMCCCIDCLWNYELLLTGGVIREGVATMILS